MKQLGLFRPEKKSVAQKKQAAEDTNVMCARIILQNPEAHGGEGSLPVIWSERVLERWKKEHPEAA